MNVTAPPDSPTHEKLGFVSTLDDDVDDDQGNTRRQQELEYRARQIGAEVERLRQQGKDSLAQHRADMRNAMMKLMRQYEEERDADRRRRASERQHDDDVAARGFEDGRARHE